MARIYGTTFGSMKGVNGSKANKGAGARGESLVEELLNSSFKKYQNVCIFHDLNIPKVRGANTDHIFLVGDCMYILDSKMWRSGFYWSFSGHSYCGLKRFEPAEKHTVGMAMDKWRDIIPRETSIYGALIICQGSARKPQSLWALRLPDGVEKYRLDNIVAHLKNVTNKQHKKIPNEQLVRAISKYVKKKDISIR